MTDMSEFKIAQPYVDIRWRIHRAVEIIMLIILCPSLLGVRFDFGGFFRTDFYRSIASMTILFVGSISWIIFIRFRDDTSWILKELGLEGDNPGISENSATPSFFTFVNSCFIWNILYFYGKNGNGNWDSLLSSQITVVIVFLSVHYLSFAISRMLGMYRYASAKTDTGSDSGKIL
jgi:hypothetical protein